MSGSLPPIVASRKVGSEPLHLKGKMLPITLLSFWQWSTSDLVSNVTRGRLAEFIVANAIGVDVSGSRNDWDTFDLTTPAGIKVEVKSAAYIQSWFQARLSNVVFQAPPTRAWDSSTGLYSSEVRRQAEVYVLAFLHHEDKLTIDPLDLAQWSFFVLPTKTLDERKRSRCSISLRSLQAIVQSVEYSQLAAAVTEAGHVQRSVVDHPEPSDVNSA